MRVGYRFGPFELSLTERFVMRGRHPVPLSPKEFAVLALLVRESGEVVETEDFIRDAWAGAPIEEGSLRSYIKNLRQAIGEDVILTVRKTGYRLVPQVERAYTAAEQRAVMLATTFLEAEVKRQSMPDAEWDELYKPLIDEVRASLDWSLAHPTRRHIAVALGGTTARLFERLSLLPEGRTYCDRVLDLVYDRDADSLDDDVDRTDAARLFQYAGILWREADRPRSLSLFKRAATLCRETGDTRTLGQVLTLVGGAHLYLGNYADAELALGAGEKILRTSDQTKWLWNALNDSGYLASLMNFPEKARRYFELARDLAIMLRDPIREGIVILNFGEMEFRHNAIDRAIERMKEAVSVLRPAPASFAARPLVNLSTYYCISGDIRSAASAVRSAFHTFRQEGGYWLRLCLQPCALIACHNGYHADAARLLGFVNSAYLQFGEAWQLAERQLHDIVLRALSENLTPESLRIWSEEGARWSEAQAVNCASTLFVSTN
jgi:DNA-binding winged helix-turn-helix (wHTH) protein